MKNRPNPNNGSPAKRPGSSDSGRGVLGERKPGSGNFTESSAHETSISNGDKSRNQLTEEPESHRSQSIFEAAEEVERWDAAPVQYGRRLPVTVNDNTDGDDRSDWAIMVYNGMADAEQDIRLQSIEEADRNDWLES